MEEYFTFRNLEFVRRIPSGVGYEFKIYPVEELTVPISRIHAVYKTKSGNCIADMPVDFIHHYNEIRITESDYKTLFDLFTQKHKEYEHKRIADR